MEVKDSEVSRLLDEAARRLARDTEVSLGRQQDEPAVNTDNSMELQYTAANIELDKPATNQLLDGAARISARDMETTMARQTTMNEDNDGNYSDPPSGRSIERSKSRDRLRRRPRPRCKWYCNQPVGNGVNITL
jgi:hypothetical protein